MIANSVLNVFKTASKFFKKSLTYTPIRNLHLHEYQAANILENYHLPVLKGKPAQSVEEALRVADELQKNSKQPIDFVVKAQVHAGGRGKGYFKESGLQGGVHLLYSKEQIKEYVPKMLGNTLITKQSGSAGKPCNTVYVVERVYMRKEHYLSIFLDRGSQGPMIIVSEKGGGNIEEVDKKYIQTIPIDIKQGITEEQAVKAAKTFNLGDAALEKQAVELIKNLYTCFIKSDASLVEINPLAVTNDGRLLICDCKVNVDDNAKFRQGNLFALDDLSQKDPREIEADKYNLNYIALDGNIGCMVNGAGLAMATMDVIKLKGGMPANFLDVGGGADEDQVTEAMKILNSDKNVQAILVNIFGGIARCDMIARGLVNGIRKANITKPIVLRLKGTNIDEAKKIIADSKERLFFCDDLEVAAEKAAKIANIEKLANEINIKVTFDLLK